MRVSLDERLLALDDLINAIVRVISQFFLSVGVNGTIGSAAPGLKAASFSGPTGDERKNIRLLSRRGISNGIVKGDTQGRVRVFAAFATIEQIRLDVLEDGEQSAALLVGDALPIRTGDTTDQRSCDDDQ